MKKTFSVLLALVMVLGMTFSVLAVEKPTDPTDTAAWTAYYTELLDDEESDPLDIAAAIVADVNSGAVDKTVAVEAVENAALELGTDTADAVVVAVMDFLGLTEGPSLPDNLPDDDYLPSFLDRILEAILDFIGMLASILFGGN